MAISVDNTYLTNYSTDASASAADKLSSQIQNASTDDETVQKYGEGIQDPDRGRR